MNRSRLLVVSYVQSEQKEKRLRAVIFWGVCEMVHIRGARALLTMLIRRLAGTN
jgi:hypothetical protein